jgi:GWxTD domain-containing protein
MNRIEKVKKNVIAALGLGMLVGLAVPVIAQDLRSGSGYVPLFFFDAISYAADDKGKSRIDFYVQVPYEELRFVKEGEGYLARYDVTLVIENAEEKLLQDRSWSVDVRVQDFAQTVSRKQYSLAYQSLVVDPGSYQVSISVKDQDTKTGGKLKRAMLVTDYSKGSLALSDIMIVSRLTTTAEGKNRVVPNISGNVGTEGEGFFLYFEVYDSTASGTVSLTSKIYNQAKELVGKSTREENLSSARTQAFMKIDSLTLPVGTYLVTVEAVNTGKDADPGATTSRSFTARWADIPMSITDLSKAVDQLRYIAKPSEYDYVREAETDEQRKTRFLDFWNKRDPDPSTPRNELMEEYYQRVEYASKNFGHFIEGWKTDMGMVYIRFGPPDNIERHPFDAGNKPFEVWYYYQLERQFLFVDDSGFGDYKLRYPTTDLWGRIR